VCLYNEYNELLMSYSSKDCGSKKSDNEFKSDGHQKKQLLEDVRATNAPSENKDLQPPEIKPQHIALKPDTATQAAVSAKSVLHL